MIGLGLSLPSVATRRNGVGGTSPGVPATPGATVTWLTPASNSQPSFLVDASGWQPADVLEFEFDTTLAFSNASNHNIGAAFSLPTTITSDPLSDGAYYARARIVRGGVPFSWSAIVTVTILQVRTRIDSPTTRIYSTTTRIDA